MSTDAAGIVADIDAAMLAAVPAYATHRAAIRDGLFAAVAEGIAGYEGPDGGGWIELSDAAPQALGVAAAGSTGEASDAGHVHPKPTAAQVGAEPAGTMVAHLANTNPHPAGFTFEVRVTDPSTPADGRVWLRSDL